MSHILEFSVDGLVGSKTRYQQTLGRDVNIFFGSNGSGKTSLMKILHSALQCDAGILENVLFTRAEVKIFSVTYGRSFIRTIAKEKQPEAPTVQTAEVTIRSLSGVARKKPTLEWNTSPAEPHFSELAHVFLPISRLYSSPTEPERVIAVNQVWYAGAQKGDYTEEDLNRRFAEALTASWISYSADISNIVRQAQQKGLEAIAQPSARRS